MKGSIYTEVRCPVCGGMFHYDANRSLMYCRNNHPEIKHYGKCRVHYKQTKRRFFTVEKAEQFLNHLRWQHDKYDPRDYQKSNPLGFSRLADQWLIQKGKEGLKPTSLANIRKEIGRAQDFFQSKNIKDITNGECEDFIWFDHKSERGGIVSSKTRASIRNTLHAFFAWVSRREQIHIPEIPTVSFELSWRTIVDIGDQAEILRELQRISFNQNPRIWLGVHILSHNVNVRPGELLKVKHGDIMLESGLIWVKYPKEGSLKQGKQAWLWEEEIEVLKSLPTTLPDTYLFHHIKGVPGVPAGQRFSEKYLNIWWKKACKNLGIVGVTLYPGTKHSTMTALSKMLSPEQVRRGGSQHASKAMERYLIPNRDEVNLVQETLKKKQKGEVINFKEGKK